MPHADLMAQAVPSPRDVHTRTGGGLLALAVHCVMVSADFGLVDGKGQVRWGRFEPPAGWDTDPVLEDKEWFFRYRHRLHKNDFVVHLSLDEGTGRMLVHAHELTRAQLAWLEEVKANGGKEKRPQPKMENMAVVGLLLSKYVADTEASDWSDTIIHEDQLLDNLLSYIVLPLESKAEPRTSSMLVWEEGGWVTATAAVLVGMGALGFGFWAWRRYAGGA